MHPADGGGAMVGMVAALLLVVGVVASALVLKKQGIIGKGNPEVPKSGVTTDPEAHLSDINSKKEAGKQVKVAKTKSASQDSNDEEVDKDSGRLPAGTQVDKGFSPLNTDVMTESVEVAMDNENSTSDRKPETPKKSEKPSFDNEGEPKKSVITFSSRTLCPVSTLLSDRSDVSGVKVDHVPHGAEEKTL